MVLEATAGSSILLSISVDDYHFGINPTSLVRVSFLSGSSNLTNDLSLRSARGVPSRAIISISRGTAHI